MQYKEWLKLPTVSRLNLAKKYGIKNNGQKIIKGGQLFNDGYPAAAVAMIPSEVETLEELNVEEKYEQSTSDNECKLGEEVCEGDTPTELDITEPDSTGSIAGDATSISGDKGYDGEKNEGDQVGGLDSGNDDVLGGSDNSGDEGVSKSTSGRRRVQDR